jgi:hypothetical protein
MVTEPLNDPQYWRRRAEETRRMAAEMKDGAAKDTLREIAQSYDNLAALAERITLIDAKAGPQ